MTEERTRKPNIAISPSTKERLEKIGKFGETYDDIIRRLLEHVAELEEKVRDLEREMGEWEDLREEEVA